MMKKLLILIILFLVTSNSYACLCEEYNSYKERIEATDYIVQGTVISKSYVTHYDTIVVNPTDTLALMFADDNGLIIQPEKLIEIKVSVVRVYKGDISSEIITVYTSPSSAACGDLNFMENKEYFIYGSSNAYPIYYQADQNSFYTTKCSGNRLFSELHRQELTQYFDR